MRTSALFPEPKELPTADSLHGLYMGRVLSVDPATYSAKVEVEDGSVTIQTTVMTLRAHNATGWTWLPEEGELVVVAFLGGAKTRPVIMGSMFDSHDTIPNTEEGATALTHKSGAVLTIDASGDIHLAHPNGHRIDLAGDDVTVTQAQGGGKFEVTHQDGQKITLEGTSAVVTSADGDTKITLDDTVATIESGASRIEVHKDAHINIFSNATAVVSLGTGGSKFAIRQDDFTGPPIGSLASHTHQVISSQTKVIIGG